MRLQPVLSVLGFLLVSVGVLMLTALPVSLCYGDATAQPIVFSSLITIVVGLLLWLKYRRGGDELRAREGFAIVTLGWVVASLFGSLPFLLSGAIPSFTDAYFETVSGFTTTGATVLTNTEDLPRGLLFWRSLTQWIGGMGIIVLSVAILPLLGVGGMQLFKAEAPGLTVDKLTPRISETAKVLWGVYVLFTAAETGLLWYGGMPLFDAVCHSFSTLATGGFSTQTASIASYNSPFLEYVIIVFMFLAATSFTLHFRALRGSVSAHLRDDEFLFFLAIVLGCTALVAFFIPSEIAGSVEARFRASLFQVVSIVTTTGFVTADYELWLPGAQVLLLLLMFIGGCAGSTGGGMKNVRILLLLRNGVVEIKKLVHPKVVLPVRFNGRGVSTDIISEILAFLGLYVAIFVLASVFVAATGLDVLSSAGAVAATLGNVGPGFGSVGAVDNYAHISGIAKWILSFCMLAGRLEVFTVLVLFSATFWKR
ncbi:MAG: TrkH family potassium uptake protein [Ignavibacteria bacterium]|nr:TrkH family potassium uptake protein [Ignavibacteria bacterium]